MIPEKKPVTNSILQGFVGKAGVILSILVKLAMRSLDVDVVVIIAVITTLQVEAEIEVEALPSILLTAEAAVEVKLGGRNS
jgi:hypothetical protein